MTLAEIQNSQQRWFHGTSDIYLNQIQTQGLKLNEAGRLYLTTEFFTAQVEAYNTVIGDLGYGIQNWPPQPQEFQSPGVGGQPVVLEIAGSQVNPRYLMRDPEYPQEESAYVLTQPLPPQAIVKIHRLPSEPSQAVIDYWRGV